MDKNAETATWTNVQEEKHQVANPTSLLAAIAADLQAAAPPNI
jgi:hypothetical protein